MNHANPVLSPGETVRSRFLVSIIIPTMNRARMIAQTLASIVQQTHRPIEIVIIDDGGSDETKNVVTRFPHTVYHWQPNQGVSAARNVGFRLSSGNYIQFLDSDDLLEANKLGAQVEYLEQHSLVDIVYGDARYFTTEDPGVKTFGLSGHPSGMADWGPWIKEGWEEPGNMALKFIRRNLMPVCCPLARRDAIAATGLWDESLRGNEDWEFWLRASSKGARFQFIESPNTMSLIRTHRESISWNTDAMSNLTFRLYLARQLSGALLVDNYERGCGLLVNKPLIHRIYYKYLLLRQVAFDREALHQVLATGFRRRASRMSRALGLTKSSDRKLPRPSKVAIHTVDRTGS